MLVAIWEITEGGREGVIRMFSEVMMGWRGVWSRSTPRGAPAEGPPLARARGSDRMHRHSQGPPPGAEQGGKESQVSDC